MHSDEDDEEEDSAPSSTQPVAFAVDGEFPPEAGSPQTGLDFLRRVRWEARRLPDVVVAEKTATASASASAQPSIATGFGAISEQCEPVAAASLAWEAEFVPWFSDLRDRTSAALLRSPPPSPASAALPADWSSPASLPTLGVLSALDHVAVLAALDAVSQVPPERLTRPLLVWLFALLAAVEKPLDDSAASALHSVLRSCCVRRAAITHATDPLTAPLNIIIAVTGLYFHQLGRP
jgi:survival of motor neuron protein-interacting protein 1